MTAMPVVTSDPQFAASAADLLDEVLGGNDESKSVPEKSKRTFEPRKDD